MTDKGKVDQITPIIEKNEKLTAKVEALQNEKDQLSGDNAKLQQTNEVLRNENAELQQKLDDLTAEKEKWEAAEKQSAEPVEKTNKDLADNKIVPGTTETGALGKLQEKESVSDLSKKATDAKKAADAKKAKKDTDDSAK